MTANNVSSSVCRANEGIYGFFTFCTSPKKETKLSLTVQDEQAQNFLEH